MIQKIAHLYPDVIGAQCCALSYILMTSSSPYNVHRSYHDTHLTDEDSEIQRWKDPHTDREPHLSDSKMMFFLQPQWCWNAWYKYYIVIILKILFSHPLMEPTDIAKERERWKLCQRSHSREGDGPWLCNLASLFGLLWKMGILKWPLWSCHLST